MPETNKLPVYVNIPFIVAATLAKCREDGATTKILKPGVTSVRFPQDKEKTQHVAFVMENLNIDVAYLADDLIVLFSTKWADMD